MPPVWPRVDSAIHSRDTSRRPSHKPSCSASWPIFAMSRGRMRSPVPPQ